MRLVIADDDGILRAGLRVLLGSQPEFDVVGEAATGTQLLELVGELDPDLVLVDVRMPEMDGIQATRELVARDRERPKILILTTFENDDYVESAIRAGATGFVLKRAEPEQLYAAIRLVGAGGSMVFPQAAQRMLPASPPATSPVPPATSPVPPATPPPPASATGGIRFDRLTAREAEILRLMAAGQSNAEIAKALFIGLYTVKSHVGSILSKLPARDRTQAVALAYRNGFIGDPGQPSPGR